MSSMMSQEYVCTLSEELVKRAVEELNENPQERKKDIQILRDMVKKNTDLKIRTDDSFLLRFLRARKFDHQRAYELVLRHFTMKAEKDNVEVFENFRPSAVKHVLEAGVTGFLPHRDKLGRRVMMFRPGRWDPSRYGIHDVFRTNFMSLTKIVQEEETQVNGVIIVIDMKDMGWNHARSMSPFYARRIANMLQDSFPLRFKGLHYIHEPKIFDYMFALMRPFLKEKILSRLHFHGDSFEKLAEYIDPQYLPEEYGGTQPPFSNKEWMETLLQCDAEFDEEAKWGLIQHSGVVETRAKDDAIGGLVGTYKKLSI